MTCRHENFCAQVNVTPVLQDGKPPGAEPDYFICNLRVRCAGCGVVLKFHDGGVQVGGYTAYRPTLSLDGEKMDMAMLLPGKVLPDNLPSIVAVFGVPGSVN